MADRKRTRGMKFAPSFLLMLALVVADKVRPDPKECPQGKVFDTGSKQCRNCGLCCLEHEQQIGCLDQGIDPAHSCFYDASCQDETDLHPAAKMKTWGWPKILPIGFCGVVALVLVVAVPLLLVKKLWGRRRQHGTIPEDQGTRPLLEEEGSEASHSAVAEGAENRKNEDHKEPSDPGSSLQGPSIAAPCTQHGVSAGPSSNQQAGEPSTSQTTKFTDQDQTTPMKLEARNSERLEGASPPSSSAFPDDSAPIVSLRIDA